MIAATALIETFAWAFSGSLIGAAVLTLAAAKDWPSLAPTLVAETKVILVAIPATIAGAGIALAGIRERHLFRYFKDR